MPVLMEEQPHSRVLNRRVHMANERTFLAWIRTSIGIMAFGFVVEKFALFIKQMSFFFEKAEGGGKYSSQLGAFHGLPPSHGYSSLFGTLLIGLGALMGILAFVRFKRVERQIDDNTYHPSIILDLMLVISILIIGMFLAIYMIHTI